MVKQSRRWEWTLLGERPRARIARCTVVAIACLVLTSPAGAGNDVGSADAGRKIANAYCARCHVVSKANASGGIGSTPSFRMLVTALTDWRTRFRTFYARRPHPAFLSIEGQGRLREDLPPNAHPVSLPVRAIDDLLALAEEIRAGVVSPDAIRPNATRMAQ